MTENDLDEERIITDTGLEARIGNVAAPVLRRLGYRLVRVRVSGLNGMTVQIMAERPDGTLAIDDCEAISRDLSPALDVDDPIGRAYQLEVSSPGIDRPLVRRSDFVRAVGHLAKIELTGMVDGRKRLRGTVASVDEGAVRIALEPTETDPEPSAEIRLADIGEARLVLTDDLIRASLSAENRQKKQAKARRRATAGEAAATDEPAAAQERSH